MKKYRNATPGNMFYRVNMKIQIHRAVTVNLITALTNLCESPHGHAKEIDLICKRLEKHMSYERDWYTVYYSDEEYETLPNDLFNHPLKYFLKKYGAKDLYYPTDDMDNA